MPDPRKLLMTLRHAAQLFRATPGRTGRFTRLPAGVKVMVVGDLHGNVENFRLALKIANLAQEPRRHLVLQEAVHGPFSYPEGGDKSHQLLDLIAALKCQYPARLHFLLGNHELAQWQNQLIGKGDIDQNEAFRAGVERAYGEHAAGVYDAYLDLFDAADLALRTENRVFISHTYPSAKNLPHFKLATLELPAVAAEDMKLGGAVHSIVWNRDHSQANVEAFLRKVDADWIITGHIPCEQGFDAPNDRQIILDALGTPACYCIVPTDRPVTQQELLSCVGTL